MKYCYKRINIHDSEKERKHQARQALSNKEPITVPIGRIYIYTAGAQKLQLGIETLDITNVHSNKGILLIAEEVSKTVRNNQQLSSTEKVCSCKEVFHSLKMHLLRTTRLQGQDMCGTQHTQNGFLVRATHCCTIKQKT